MEVVAKGLVNLKIPYGVGTSVSYLHYMGSTDLEKQRLKDRSTLLSLRRPRQREVDENKLLPLSYLQNKISLSESFLP